MCFSQKSIFEIIMAFEHVIDSKIRVERIKKLHLSRKDKKGGISLLRSHFECINLYTMSRCLSNKALFPYVHVASVRFLDFFLKIISH